MILDVKTDAIKVCIGEKQGAARYFDKGIAIEKDQTINMAKKSRKSFSWLCGLALYHSGILGVRSACNR